MQLSKHFTLEEMTRSMTAVRKGINNIPGPGEIKNLGNLCYEVLEPTRAHFDKPLSISSGYRSEALCEAIGSQKNQSQHALGCAADFEINSVYLIFKLLIGSLTTLTLINAFSSTINPKTTRQDGSTYLMMLKDLTENKYLPLMVKNTPKVYQK